LWQEENRASKAYYLSSDAIQKLNRFINAAGDITGQKYDYIYNQRQK
jgi:hypothetical protein